MTRHAPALLALSVIAVAGWTYNVNYDTRAAFDRLSALRGEIAGEREALQVLRVEWAYLNAPERLAELVAAHDAALGLVPLLPEALGIAAAVPYPPRETPDLPPARPEALIAAAPAMPATAEGATPRALTEAGGPTNESITLAALSRGGETAVAAPAMLQEASAPVPSPSALASEPGAETVPAALETAIAAALAQVGVPPEQASGTAWPQGGIIAAADRPAGILATAAGAPVPAARPAVWSRR